MPQSKTPRRKGHGEVIPPLIVLDRIDALLREHLAIFPSKVELTDEEIEHWHRDLSKYPLEAIEYAFDCWRRNGRFFPVFADLLDLCQAFEPSQRQQKQTCSRECQERHHKGYGWPDVLKLWKLHGAKRQELGRALEPEEWEALLVKVDELRGGPPNWRIAA